LIFDQTGEVRDGFYVLGSRDVPLYLLQAKRSVIFDAGIVKLGRIYEEEIRAVLKGQVPALLLLTHVHFDHCGTVSYLKRVFPALRIGASRRASEIIKRPNAVNLIRRLSEDSSAALAGIEESRLLDEPFEPFEVDMVLDDGEVIELENGLTVQVIAAPGHTADFLAYYIPERKMLISSEAGGCTEYSGTIHTACLNDFGVYLATLRRLASLEVEILCQGHRLIHLGDDAKTFLGRSMATALEFKALVQQLWKDENKDLGRIMARIKVLEYDPLPLPKQPEPAFLANLEARVKSIVAYSGDEKASVA